MKLNSKKATYLVAALAAMFAAPMAFAASAGTVTFNGQLIADTCEIRASDVDQTVTLPTLSTQSLAKAGDKAGSTMFEINVNNCPAAITTVAAHFETTDMDPETRNAMNKATGGTAAQNVNVQLLDRDGTTEILLGSTGSSIAVTDTADGRGAKLSYGGQYFATAATTPGNVTAVVRYTLAYN